MSTRQIGYLAHRKGSIDCACKGENLIVMNNPVLMKNFNLKQIELQKVYSNDVIQGLKQGGQYLFSEKSYKDFMAECIENYPHLFPPHRLVVQEPVSNVIFYQVSWDNTSYNTPQ